MNFPSVKDYSAVRRDGISYTDVNVPSVIATSALTLGGNSGRKFVRLIDGTLIVAARTSSSLTFTLYKSINNGLTWSQFLSGSAVTGSDVALATDGTNIFVFWLYSTTYTGFYMYDSNGNTLSSKNPVTNQSKTNGCSIVYRQSDNTIHVTAGVSSGAQYSIQYLQGTINADNSVTWGAIQTAASWSSSSQNCVTPSITLDNNGSPVILFEFYNTSITGYDIYSCYLLNGTWSKAQVYGVDGNYQHTLPSAIFVPQSINGLQSGLIATAWQGQDAVSGDFFVRFSKSTNGGSTWSTMQKFSVGQNVSLTADSRGILYIEYDRNGSVYYIKSADNGDTWSQEIYRCDGVNANTLLDLTLKLDEPYSFCEDNSAQTLLFRNPYTVQQFADPPELYIPLYWYSGSYSSCSQTYAGTTFLVRGFSGSLTTTPGTSYVLPENWSPDTKFAFEVSVYINNSSYMAYAALYDITTSTVITASQVGGTNQFSVLRSGQFSLIPGHSYAVTVWANNSSYTTYITDASLIVFPQ